MPKDLGDVRGLIITAAKEMLIKHEKFSIRALSAKAGIAIGTIYNYFPAKENIIAAVMSEDWRKTLDRMDLASEEAEDLREGCRAFYRELRAFVLLFESVWMAYGRGNSYEQAREGFHVKFRNALTERISGLFLRFDQPLSEELLPVFGEVLIACGIGTDLSESNYEAFLDILL